MKNIHYADAVPPVPEHFKRAIAETLGGLEAMNSIHRRKAVPILAIVLLSILALTGIAYAATRAEILSLIFTRSTPGENAAAMVVHLGKTAEGENMSFTVSDYILDGTDLYVNWSIQLHTDEELTLISGGLETAFDPSIFSDNGLPDSLGAGTLAASSRNNGRLSGLNRGRFYDAPPDEPFEVTLCIGLVRHETGALRALTNEEQTEYSQWIRSQKKTAGEGHARLSAIEKFGRGEVIERLELTFTVHPEGKTGKSLKEPAHFERADYAITVLKAEFTGVNAQIECIWSHKDGVPSADELDFEIWADGEKVRMSCMRDEETMSFWTEGGCSLLPEELVILPGRWIYADEGRFFVPSEADKITISLTDRSLSAQGG